MLLGVRLWYGYVAAMVRLWCGYGTAMVRLWYGFYGVTLESDEAFEGKVEEPRVGGARERALNLLNIIATGLMAVKMNTAMDTGAKQQIRLCSTVPSNKCNVCIIIYGCVYR